MKYAVIVWTTKDDKNPGPGVVYGWYKTKKECIEKAKELVQTKQFYEAAAVKAL